jgi:AcrR family transcriptional regulator
MSPRVSAEQREVYLQNRRDQILDAAIEVFARNGYERTNVSDIAGTAGIAKGTIYLYFKSKEEIFDAILTERSFVPLLAELTVDHQAPFEEVLQSLIENYLDFVENHLQILHMAIAEAYRFPAHADILYQQIVLKGSEILADYLTSQTKAGRIRKLDDPLLTAQVIMGMVAAYLYSQELLRGKHIMPIPSQAWAKEVTRFTLCGICPDDH